MTSTKRNHYYSPLKQLCFWESREKYVQKCEYALRNDTVSYKPYHNKDKGE